MIHVTKQLGDNLLLDDITIQLEDNELVSIKCSNYEATVLLDILSNKISFEGEIRVGEVPIHSEEFNKREVSIIYSEDSYYNRMTVKEYLNFFKQLSFSSCDYKDIIALFRLEEIENKKISKMDYSEKRRLSFSRAFISNAKLIVVHEPMYNLNRESRSVIIKALSGTVLNGRTVILLSSALENALLFDCDVYAFEQNKLKQIDVKTKSFEASEKTSEQDVYDISNIKLDKIPAKVGDKIVLINPFEIEYIEADAGMTYIYFGDEKVSCTITMTDLENRLKQFGFFRSHRSYLVNLQKIREVVVWTRNSYSLVLDNKKKSSIPLSKGRLEDLKGVFKI